MFYCWGWMLFFISIIMFNLSFFLLKNFSVFVIEYYLLLNCNFEFKLFLLFDWMSFIFSSVVLFISSMVIFYSLDYMKAEKFKNYFCWMVLLFVGSMILMIFSPNLLMILIGWDGLGLVSYCLVIYYQNYKSYSAGMITVLSNRVGDVMILLALVMMINFGNYDFLIFKKVLLVGGFFLIISGMTKSAQIPFSAWLPAAMAAPTPVSALVHSSTLVTAGVYLLIRLNFLFEIEVFSKFLLYFALITMIMSGVGAMFEMDLKKIIALSTLSQLGLMMLILSLGKMNLAFFHLLTHAVFKAMLFLCAGCMIHSSLSNQDIRYFGLFFQTSPLIACAFSLANMSLFGVPFLSGFYSKDLILEFIYKNSSNFMIWFLLIFATFSTVIYSLRVMYYSLWKGSTKMFFLKIGCLGMMELTIIVMSLFVVFFGSMLSWLLMPYVIFLNLKIKVINMVIIFMGSWILYIFFSGKLFFNFVNFLEFFGNMWFLPGLTCLFAVKGLKGGYYFVKGDNGWMEELGPQGLYKMNVYLLSWVQGFQNNGFKNFFVFLIFISLFFF
uniref:NADH-ubiquinone oxidoreductase chain 5 n=1 Tax=Otobius megnini TaxID=34606 RepID=W0FDE8_OTOMG|nr:NADH dehydrogenase subunit 5 [Otobius megnini]AHF21633.1 NADH dehydrogenase subunit 5 [Otobius megnini]AIZ58592.1 NADH dehydrogenase subunit 5 [Otobius megnini]UYB78412.1 NADH dehydrogenase subunit 5 [Otobius megnini]